MRSMSTSGLTLDEAIQVRSAEMWLEVGQPLQALHSLTDLPDSVWACPWPRTVLIRINKTIAEGAGHQTDNAEMVAA